MSLAAPTPREWALLALVATLALALVRCHPVPHSAARPVPVPGTLVEL